MTDQPPINEAAIVLETIGGIACAVTGATVIAAPLMLAASIGSGVNCIYYLGRLREAKREIGRGL